MTAYRIRSTAIFVSPRVELLYDGLSRKNGERSVEVLHRFGVFLVTNSETFSVMKTPKVLTLFQPLISEHKFSTCMTVEADFENLFTGLPQLAWGTGTASLLVCLSTFCNRLSVKQVLRPRTA